MKAWRTQLTPDQKKVYSIGEDFSESVKRSRRRLVAFARKRSRVTKKKWALKYDQLFMNGKVFEFSKRLGKVVSTASGNVQRMRYK